MMGDGTNRGRMQRANNAGGRRCGRCGLQFDKFSVANHDRWCRQSYEATPRKEDDGSAGRVGDVVARVVTIGLTPGKPDFTYIHAPKKSPERKPPASGATIASTSLQPPQNKAKTRPSTSTLKDSRLQKMGHGVPSQTNQSSGNGLVRCNNCKRLVAGNRLDAHVKVCNGETGHAQKHSSHPKKPPHSTSLPVPGPDQGHSNSGASSLQSPFGHSRKFVICYICGREYTVHSIGIHVPQCTKKFHAENEILPIRQRRPFPKKPEPPRAMMEDNRELGGASVDLDTAVQNYFEHCYTTFEDTLIPCRVCGRTFAADRHKIHEPNCKAKPIAK